MVLVSEPTDSEFGPPSLVSCGGQSEARVYCNGQPVGINLSDDRIAAAPPPKVGGDRGNEGRGKGGGRAWRVRAE